MVTAGVDVWVAEIVAMKVWGGEDGTCGEEEPESYIPTSQIH